MINWLAVIVVAIAHLILGSIWYGPIFGKAWMEIAGMTAMSPEQKKAMQKKMMPMYLLQFALSILTAWVLAWNIGMIGTVSGIQVAFWVWLGFVMPVVAGNSMWSGKSKKIAWKMFWITTSYNLIAFLIAGAIIGGWK